MRRLAAFLLVCLLAATAAAQDTPAPRPQLTTLSVSGATIYSADDITWMLQLRRGEPLPAAPEEIGKRLERLYAREGYTAAKVTATLDAGTLTLAVDEGRFEEIVVEGAPSAVTRAIERSLEAAGVRSGEPFHEPAARRAVRRVLETTTGGVRLQRLDLVERTGRRVLRVGVRREGGDVSLYFGTEGREDLFAPVDGLSLAGGLGAVAYDRSGLNYTFIGGFAGWKFSRDDASYSIGIERPLLSNTRLFIGAEWHDVTASDDMWRLNGLEQTVAAAGFKNTFRDYYRRRGVQVHAGARPNGHNEFLMSWRWDRHEPLENTSDFSLFRQDREYRANPLVADAELGALVLGYSFDTETMNEQTAGQRFRQHLAEDLFRARRNGRLGLRLDWTSEIAGRAMNGDYDFTRHILNLRGGLPLGPRQVLAGRGVFGWSTGTLPIEREFAIGGIGTIHAHKFKEAAGSQLALFNAEYGLNILGDWEDADTGALRLLFFYDAGRVGTPVRGTDDWLSAVGIGLQTGPIRIEWGFKPDDIPKSGQVIVRLGRGF